MNFPHRAHFLHDCVTDMRAQLRQLGSDLVVRWGHPERELRLIAELVGARTVHCHSGVTREEVQLQDRVRNALHAQSAELRCCWGGTLHAPDELPFKHANVPATFSAFRAAVAPCTVPRVLSAPANIRRLPAGCPPCGDIPPVEQLCGQQKQSQQSSVKTPHVARARRGGETEALRVLADIVSKESRGQRVASQVTALSPWLAMGSLSPRRVYHDIRHACQARASYQNQGGESVPQWVSFELIWRDYFVHSNAVRARSARDVTQRTQPALTVTSVCA